MTMDDKFMNATNLINKITHYVDKKLSVEKFEHWSCNWLISNKSHKNAYK